MGAELGLTSALLCAVLLAVAALGVGIARIPPWLKTVVAVALVLRVALGVLNLSYDWFRAPDAETYHTQAVALMNGQDPTLYVVGKEAWPQILSTLYSWSEPSVVIPVVLNAVLCVAMLPLVFVTTEKVRPGAGRYAVTILLFMPSWWIWGAPGLREPLVWVLSLVALWALVVSASQVNRAGLPVFAVAIVLFAWVRGPLALVIGVAGGAALLIAKRPSPARIAALGGLVVLISAVVTPRLQQIPALRDGTTEVIRGELSRGGSGFDASNPLVVGARVVTGPWPSEIPSLGPAVLPDVIFLWVALFLAWHALPALRARAAVFVLPAAGIAASLAVTSGNYGTMLRLRTQALVWLVPLLAVGYSTLREKRVSALRERERARSVGSPSTDGSRLAGPDGRTSRPRGGAQPRHDVVRGQAT